MILSNQNSQILSLLIKFSISCQNVKILVFAWTFMIKIVTRKKDKFFRQVLSSRFSKSSNFWTSFPMEGKYSKKIEYFKTYHISVFLI